MLILIAGMALAGASSQGDVDSPTIVVSGSSVVKTPPNVVSIDYEVRGEGSTSDEATRSLVAKAAAIENALRAFDPKFELHSDDMKIQGVRREACKSSAYDDSVRLSTGDCAIVGFVATQDFELQSARVSDAGTLVGLAGREGASNPSIGRYGLTDERPAKRQAIAAALADAKEKAEATALASGAPLGAVIDVSLDDARQQTTITVTAEALNRLGTSRRTAPVVVVPVAPSPIETTARATVTYRIGR